MDMVDELKPSVLADPCLVGFDLRRLELLNGSTAQTDEVIMMSLIENSFVKAAIMAECRLAKDAAFLQEHQRPVDGGPADTAPAAAQSLDQLFRFKVPGGAKDFPNERFPLFRHPEASRRQEFSELRQNGGFIRRHIGSLWLCI